MRSNSSHGITLFFVLTPLIKLPSWMGLLNTLTASLHRVSQGVYHRPPDCTRGSPHSSAHPGTLWCWLSSWFRKCEVAWRGTTWNHTKDHNRSRKLCFHHPGHVPVIRGNPAMVLVIITWIGRQHELYSGASPISLVEHCVTFKHDRRHLLLLALVHNWPTSR